MIRGLGHPSFSCTGHKKADPLLLTFHFTFILLHFDGVKWGEVLWIERKVEIKLKILLYIFAFPNKQGGIEFSLAEVTLLLYFTLLIGTKQAHKVK